MAGDWIKIEENMPDKPEVCQMAARLGIDSDAVAGKLLRVWAWAGRNCNADGVTSVTVKCFIDRISAVTGFADAMASVGWLHVSDDSLAFPKFDRHCSQTAKERANTNRRVANHRNKSNAGTVTNVTLETLQKPLPEKRREDTNTPLPPKGAPQEVLAMDLPPATTPPPAPEHKSALQLRAEAIFNRRPEVPLTSGEARAFKKSKPAIEATTEADWLLLEKFYAAPQSETFTRKDLATLVNNWNGEIDRAKAWKANGGGKQEQVLTFITA